ncbi:unnamed protein product [Cyclocybe aegerita]|uniref:DUF7330 domain-containing protein n=1 Tax=Cyclocybe aegerita TaxID=1973307 RepID=A0A8S0XYS6_CYCAE|nr:unnamed protein product [Cyclocybe aegerita]
MSPHGAQPLRVVNRGDFVDAENVSGGPPPGYTLQQDMDTSGSNDKSITMAFHPADGARPIPSIGDESSLLPSPYSTEDLFLGIGQRPDSATLPPTFQPWSPGQIYLNNQTSQAYRDPNIETPQRMRTVRTTFHPSTSSVTIPSSVNHGHAQVSPSSPSSSMGPYRRGTYRGHPSEPLPAAIGHLTYHPSDTTDAEDTRNVVEDPALPAHFLGSSITFLDDGLHFRQARDAPPMPAERHGNSATVTRNPSAATSIRSAAQGRATNYVSLSRKCTQRRARFSLLSNRQKTRTASITGSFAIDPQLRIPASLLRTVDPRASAPGEERRATCNLLGEQLARTRSKSKFSGQRRRRKNLVLEVENGGIDVDIELIPTPSSALISTSRLDIVDASVAPNPATRTSVDKPAGCSTSDLRARSSLHRGQSTRSELIVKKPIPTVIDLRLKERNGTSSKRQKRIPSLVARFDAPHPRPPLHIFASTIVDPLAVVNNACSVLEAPAWSRSPVKLHLPRTFHGPLAIHVAAADVNTHIFLSQELSEAAVVLSETAFYRAYFVGGLASFRDTEDISDGWELVEEIEEDEEGRREEPATDLVEPLAQGDSGANDIDRTGHHEAMDPANATTLALKVSEARKHADHESCEQEWFGDKIEILVGDGKVYLQYLDEVDPFGRGRGFWRHVGFRR